MVNIVLFEPEIPQNTGNIMRTCVATGSMLHLIKPLGFSLDEKSIKRSGANYIDKLNYKVYEDYNHFVRENPGTYYYFTRYGKKPHSDFNYSNKDENIYLIFGRESTGIDKKILKGNLDRCIRIPMLDDVRSLNLSNCVAIVLYEVLRQRDYDNLLRCEPHKGENYLEELDI